MIWNGLLVVDCEGRHRTRNGMDGWRGNHGAIGLDVGGMVGTEIG